ncbi:MAG: hypothetical protein M0R51_16605 [Clostridia bacterium]|jgi:hypothetical protein|nr:hypothetical protein [Clostridia bacterium]
MNGLDLINFFLHDKIAAKTWYRAMTWKADDSVSIMYRSMFDSNQQFIVSLFDDDTSMIGYLNHGYETYISSENIMQIRSMNFSIWFDLRNDSFIRIMYWN